MQPEAPAKLWNRNYILLLVLGFFSSSSFYMVTPTLSKYSVELGASLAVAGTLAGMMSITALIMRPIAAVASDRLNRKKLMIIATTVIGLSVLGYSISTNMVMLFIFRIIHGSAFAISGTANMSFATNFIPDDKMGSGLGYLTLGNIVAGAFGPTVGLELGSAVGYRYVYIISGVLALIAAAGMLMIPYNHVVSDEQKKRKIVLSDLIEPSLIPYAFLIGMFSLANGLTTSFLALLGDNRGIANVSLFFTAHSIGMLAIRPIAGPITDKKGIGFVLYPSYVLVALAMFMVAGAQSFGVILAAGFIKALGQGTGQPSIQAHAVQRLGKARSGVAISTCYIGQDMCQGIGPTIGGAVASSFGYGTMFAASGVLLLMCMALFFFLRRYEKSKGII